MSQYTNPPQGQNPPSTPNAPSPRQQDPGHSSGQTPPSGQSTSTSAQTPPAAQCPPPNPETPRPSVKCDPLPTGPETPTLPPIDPCDTPCCCPRPPGTPGTCLDDLIAKQVQQIAAAEYAKASKAELEDLLKKTNAAKQDYTKTKYLDLRDRWDKEDAALADLIAKLVCAVPCWKCVVECELCTLLDTVHQLELKLDGDGRLTTQVYSLRDLQYWQQRNCAAKQAVVDRFKAVLAAWAAPAQTLDKILTDNAKAIDDIKKIIATDSAGALFALFAKVLPLHLAIAPRDASSIIDAKYTDLCCCYPGTPDDCCGPDVGVPSLLQELIGPQPYIVDPADLFDIICCLATERYLPAKDQLAQAAADLAKTDADIAKAKSDIYQKWASIAADFKASVANPINCDDYKSKGNNGGQQNPCMPQSSSSQIPHGR